MIFNPWDADGENAVEGEGAEIFDQCDGHPDMRGTYHYHKMPSSCLFDIVGGEASPLIGVAFDGFAIYGPNDENGRRLSSADLDECHGRFNSEGVYQYHTTSDFPYILGCYKGTPVRTGGQKCYSASDANSDGNVLSTQAGDEGDDEGQARPPPNGRPRGERIGVRHHRPIGQDNRMSRTDGRPAGNPGRTHYRPYRGAPRDRRDVDEEANLNRVRRVQPMLPANLFQRRLPSGYKEWLSDIVFNRT
ncbi:hypothetical protein BSL78_03961 [Apostichopus japonicus]|uniref:YHYH domain-containing protein n=1 Tax=Stichopus japonicus TaxID=307972 RepID=A0A2G8LFP5_STIJA|nr:hypothetical protein BSL78_03961 [Apostichopus japonicus]